MRAYFMLKNELKFLKKEYGFKIVFKEQSYGSHCITWSNSNINIDVIYNPNIELPVSIRIYDSDSCGLYATKYKDEFEQRTGKPREKIHNAAEWLKKAISDKIITI